MYQIWPSGQAPKEAQDNQKKMYLQMLPDLGLFDN